MSDQLPLGGSLSRPASMMNRIVSASLMQPFLVILLTLILTGASTYGGGTTIAASGAGTLEATADIEIVAALAPRAGILVYQAPLSGGDESIVDTYGAIAQQDRAQVVSGSWGGCEPLAGTDVIRVEAQLFQEMALQGQSMMAAAGDSGSEGCLPGAAEVPASSARSFNHAS